VVQNEGALKHRSANVRNNLNGTCPRRWIGRGGPTHWEARSPDLTPPDSSAGLFKEQNLWAVARESRPSETPYHRGVQNNPAWYATTRETVPAMALVGMFNLRMSPFRTPAAVWSKVQVGECNGCCAWLRSIKNPNILCAYCRLDAKRGKTDSYMATTMVTRSSVILQLS
jgi:hypothetical protein